MQVVCMPRTGHDCTGGKIVEWLKAEGDPVARGEVIAVATSEKASFAVESAWPGVLLKILRPVGEEIAPAKPIALIAAADNAAIDPEPTVATADAAFIDEFSEPTVPIPAIPYIADNAPPPSVPQPIAVARSAAQVHPATVFTLRTDVDLSAAEMWLDQTNRQLGASITFTDMIVHAAAQSLREYRNLNALTGPSGMELKRAINIGFTLTGSCGPAAPVIIDADAKTLADIAQALRADATMAGMGGSSSAGEATFTVSTLTNRHVREFAPALPPTQAAVVGVGAATARVVPINGGVGVRTVTTLSLVCDSRAANGTYAAGFLNAVRRRLEKNYQPRCAAD